MFDSSGDELARVEKTYIHISSAQDISMVLHNDITLDLISSMHISGSLTYVLELFCQRIALLISLKAHESFFYSQRVSIR